jgi:hypothetical protein
MDKKIDDIREKIQACKLISRDDYVTFPCTFTIKDTTKPDQDITRKINIQISAMDIIFNSNDTIGHSIDLEIKKRIQNGLDEIKRA